MLSFLWWSVLLNGPVGFQINVSCCYACNFFNWLRKAWIKTVKVITLCGNLLTLFSLLIWNSRGQFSKTWCLTFYTSEWVNFKFLKSPSQAAKQKAFKVWVTLHSCHIKQLDNQTKRPFYKNLENNCLLVIVYNENPVIAWRPLYGKSTSDRPPFTTAIPRPYDQVKQLAYFVEFSNPNEPKITAIWQMTINTILHKLSNQKTERLWG